MLKYFWLSLFYLYLVGIILPLAKIFRISQVSLSPLAVVSNSTLKAAWSYK
jgi:hypothetical protein